MTTPQVVAEWLGLSVTVRVRVRARARECIFLLFFSLLEVTNIFVLHVSSNCDICGIRTTVCDVTMMYSQKRYMENVPLCIPFHCTVEGIGRLGSVRSHGTEGRDGNTVESHLSKHAVFI